MRADRRILIAALIAPLLIAAAATAGQGARAHIVTMEGMQFKPSELHLHPGERIVWVNRDPFPHTATAASGDFDSKGIEANGSWDYTAARKGEIDYHCTFHPTMTGKIIVQ